jgi:hypothetical protein
MGRKGLTLAGCTMAVVAWAAPAWEATASLVADINTTPPAGFFPGPAFSPAGSSSKQGPAGSPLRDSRSFAWAGAPRSRTQAAISPCPALCCALLGTIVGPWASSCGSPRAAALHLLTVQAEPCGYRLATQARV